MILMVAMSAGRGAARPALPRSTRPAQKGWRPLEVARARKNLIAIKLAWRGVAAGASSGSEL
jgi:hypothetical protein